MCKFLAIMLISVIATTIVACGSDTPEPTSTAIPAAATQAPADTPTAMPEPTPTVAPEPTATAVPVQTIAPEPTATPPATEPTATPVSAPAATSTPQPTPEQPTDDEPIERKLAPLEDNLLWVAHYDNSNQQLSVYDPTGTFSPEEILPPGLQALNESEIVELTDLAQGQIYFLAVERDQTLGLSGNTFTFFQGVNFVVWK